MTRSAQALIWSVEQFKTPRMWTFTVPFEQEARITAAMWRRLAHELKRTLGFSGIRIFEMHPGGHGLHVHVITEKYFRVQDVRFIARRMGWGRLQVDRIDAGTQGAVGRYVAKYLTKAKEMRKEWGLKGVRIWAAFGGWKDYCRVSEVEVDSVISRIYECVDPVDVVRFWGELRCSTKKLLNYWRFRLSMLIWGGRLDGVPRFDSILDWAINPAF